METKIQKWGNSLALRIPKAFADQIGIMSNSKVTIILEDDRIAILKPEKPRLTLAHLLSGITKNNLHSEVETGKPVGKEEW